MKKVKVRRKSRVRPAQINVDLREDTKEALYAFAEARGETVREVVELAVRRHLADPTPVIALPPLPALVGGA